MDFQFLTKYRRHAKGAAIVLSIGIVAGAVSQQAPTPYNLVVPRGIPRPPVSTTNPLTVQGVALGRRLFSDVRLSGNNRQSCASCHRSAAAFSDAGRATSLGTDGIAGTRNTPTLWNAVFNRLQFWDGRSPNLRNQALQPIVNPIEMHSTLPQMVSKLQADATYPSQFQAAFGTRTITPDLVARALEQFETTLLTGNSKFDQAQAGVAVLTAQEQRGRQLFFTPFNPQLGQRGADCARCHGGPLFTDNQFHNVGLERVLRDQGRGAITRIATDNGKFKTPTLRNIALTGPYMHDGRFATLERVVAHYSNGIQPSPNLDLGLARQNGGVQLSTADQAALVAFLRTLTDPSASRPTP